ncbi:MAG TPA: dual specificity protein phosphatase family protein [Candidatus Limnocylindria bacterium]|nr:dual specificity protein phosphatase family protein [Candidatus Limnocylindria bacterium]
MPPYFTSRTGRPSCALVAPGLWVGAYPEPHDFAWLAAEHGARAVLSLQDDFDLAAKRLRVATLEAAASASGLAFTRMPVADGDAAGLARRLPELVAALAASIEAHGPTYLHCNAGVNRAPTVAIAYLHVHHALALPDAVRLVKARRPCVPYLSALEAAYARRPSLRPRTP